MTTQEQIDYMQDGLAALMNTLRNDRTLFPAQRVRIEAHARAHVEVIESLCRLYDLEGV